MRNGLPVLVLLMFLGACGTPGPQPTPATSSQPSSATPTQPTSGTGSQPPSGTDPQPHSTTTYQSNSGKVSSLNAVTAALQPAGSFASPDSMGGACNYGECPAWQFANDHFSYALPDGTTADFTNFSGTADFTNQSGVKVKGTASGNDSGGTPVQVTVDWAWSASCRSGRGGGCTKTFISGSLTVVK